MDMYVIIDGAKIGIEFELNEPEFTNFKLINVTQAIRREKIKSYLDGKSVSA